MKIRQKRSLLPGGKSRRTSTCPSGRQSRSRSAAIYSRKWERCAKSARRTRWSQRSTSTTARRTKIRTGGTVIKMASTTLTPKLGRKCTTRTATMITTRTTGTTPRTGTTTATATGAPPTRTTTTPRGAWAAGRSSRPTGWSWGRRRARPLARTGSLKCCPRRWQGTTWTAWRSCCRTRSSSTRRTWPSSSCWPGTWAGGTPWPSTRASARRAT
mmetsp:Transcript_42317/g.66220  ORF Transcript_42317/g.66220 Transcript_42317/m.66220 type:complete len:214 (+) Transcript_42317:817-1458(+)